LNATGRRCTPASGQRGYILGYRAYLTSLVTPLTGLTVDEHDERYRRAAEHVQVVTQLWDSWEDGAIVDDKESGTWARPERIHRINHKGT
jgi:hypothetical protein